jgi:hypothetical protein
MWGARRLCASYGEDDRRKRRRRRRRCQRQDIQTRRRN